MKDRIVIFVLIGALLFSAVATALIFLTDSSDPATNQEQTAQNDPLDDPNRQICQTSADLVAQAGNPAGEWPATSDPVEELQVIDLREGGGATAEVGNCLSVHYRLSLADGTPVDGNDTFAAGGGPIAFELAEGSLISGWVQGIPGLKEGGVRRLIVPPSLGYGDVEQNSIPANSTLIFDVELVKVEF